MFIQKFQIQKSNLIQMNKKRKQKQGEREAVDETRQVKSLMTEGKVLYEKARRESDYEQAVRLFSNTISKASSTKILHLNHIYHLRGLCELKLKHYDMAEKDFQQAIEISDDKSKIQFYNSLGKCKLQQVNNSPLTSTMDNNMQAATISIQLEEAVKCLEKAVQSSGQTDGEAYFNLGMIYRKQNKKIEAIEMFDQAIKKLKPQDQYQAYIERGICYRDINILQSSINDFLKALQIKTDHPLAYFHLGINYLLRESHDNALEKLSSAIQLSKSEPQLYNYKGLVLFMSGQYELCLDVYREALKFYEEKKVRNSQVGECWYNLGNALINLGRYHEALQTFSKVRQYAIDEDLQIKLLYAQGRTYELTKQPESIIKFTEALNRMLEPGLHQLYLAGLFHLGFCQAQHNQMGSAIDSFTKIINLGCNDKCVYEERGKCYLKNEQHKEALRDFQVVACIDESYPDVYYYRGICKVNLGSEFVLQEAIRDFFKAIQLGSKHQAIYNGISCALLQAKQHQKALIYSNICLHNHPRTEEFLVQRSLIYLELQDYGKSIDDLTAALAVNASNPSIYYRRGLTYYRNRDYHKAITDLEKSLQFMPSIKIQPDIYYHIGIAHSNLQKYAEAIGHLTKAINLDPKPKYYRERAKCQIITDENLDALNDLNQVIKAQPSNAFAYFWRGFAHKALRLYQEAAEDFLKAKDLKPNDPRLIINKKQIYQTKYRKLCQAGEQD